MKRKIITDILRQSVGRLDLYLLGVLLAALAVSSAANVYQYRLLHSQSALQLSNKSAIGISGPSIRGIDGLGQAVTYDVSNRSRPTIIYVYSPQCHWCRANEENVSSLVKQTRARYVFLVVSLNAKPDPLTDATYTQHGSAIIYKPSQDTLRQYQFNGTPQTIVVSRSGTVQELWNGAWSNATKNEIEKYFSVTLPGLVGKTRHSSAG